MFIRLVQADAEFIYRKKNRETAVHVYSSPAAKDWHMYVYAPFCNDIGLRV